MPFSRPETVVDTLGLKPGAIVADLGAGVGAYTVPLARAVGPGGRVYAVEVQRDLLQNITSATRDQGLENVEVLWGDIERLGGTKLADDSVDLVVLANVLFQIEDRPGCLHEIARILRPEGHVLLVDWRDSYGGMGPAPEAVLYQEHARELFEREGFTYKQSVDAGDQHYGALFISQH